MVLGVVVANRSSQQVFDKLEPPHAVHHWLNELCGYTVEQIAQFRQSFFLSGKNSVDAFLEYRDDYMQIGKAAMAAILIPYEHEWHLFRYNQGWLRYLYNNLNTSFEDFGKNQLSIITFNYDRTVEHFIFTALKNTYNRTDDEVRAVVEQIPIIHLHGRLGFLPWQGERKRAPLDASGFLCDIMRHITNGYGPGRGICQSGSEAGSRRRVKPKRLG